MTNEQRFYASFMDTINRESAPNVSKERIDKFIDRCIKERDYTLSSLYQTVAMRYKNPPMYISMAEVLLSPQILQRLRERMTKEE